MDAATWREKRPNRVSGDTPQAIDNLAWGIHAGLVAVANAIHNQTKAYIEVEVAEAQRKRGEGP